MKQVCVITGGGSGMGLSTAELLGREGNTVVLTGRTVAKLQMAVAKFRAEGIDAGAFPCDVSNRKSVEDLARHAVALGTVKTVIHAAGVSPHMGDGKSIMEINALGTINVDEVFLPILEEGGSLINVSSMAGYFIPPVLSSKRLFSRALTDKQVFLRKMMRRVNLMPKKFRSDVAYGLSKQFVIWYSAAMAGQFGEWGLRILSVSPGSFETPMGELEKTEALTYRKYCALKRFGKSEEIAKLLTFLSKPDAGYLTGVDILMDGGCVTGKKYRA